MSKTKTVVAVTTYKREDLAKRLLESIDTNQVKIYLLQDDSDGSSYSNEFFEYIETLTNDGSLVYKGFEGQNGIGVLKQDAVDFAKKNDFEHLFIVEDDVVVKDNDIWAKFRIFSLITGVKHTNWNDPVKNTKIGEFKVSPEEFGDIHNDAPCACFQYFHSSIFDEFEFDVKYVNGFEHGDVEMQLASKGYIPPYRAFVSPQGVSDYLEHDDGGESTITNKEGYSENIKNGLDLWIQKWGKHPAQLTIPTTERVVKRISKIRERYGVGKYSEPTPDKHINPVSIVVTIKNRCHIKYTSDSDVMKQELQVMSQHDSLIDKASGVNKGRGITPNRDLMNSPLGFRPFDEFLKSINRCAHNFEGDVELIVTDWGSIDDDVYDLVDTFWDHDFKVIDVEDSGKFSRGYGLDKAIKEAKYDNLHITDVDMVYESPRFLEDASKLDDTMAIFPIIAKEQSPSGLGLYMECHGYGISSMTKNVYNQAGGFDDIRHWGFEDTNLFKAVDKNLGNDNVRRIKYQEAIHQWHSVRPNVQK